VEIGVNYGFRCPRGHESVEVNIGPTTPRCSLCGAEMVANQASPGVGVNTYCANCETYVGLMIGGGEKCSTCGGPLTSAP
jgi:hypothetical protein